MRASIKFKSVFITSLLMATSLAHAAPAQTNTKTTPASASKSSTAAQAAAEADNAVNALIVQKLFSSLKFSGCGFEVEGSVNGGVSSLDLLDVDCTFQLTDREDLNLNIGQTEENKAEEKGFNSAINFKSKGLYVRLLGEKIDGTTKLTARFYSGFDKAKKVWIEKPLEAALAIMNGKQVVNAELVAVRLSGIDLKIQENPKNPAEITVNGSCKSEQKIFNFVSNAFEYRPANCYLEGVYEPNVTNKFKFGFKNASAKAKLP